MHKVSETESLRACVIGIPWKTFTGITINTSCHSRQMQDQRSGQEEPVTDDSSGARDQDDSNTSQPTTWGTAKKILHVSMMWRSTT